MQKIYFTEYLAVFGNICDGDTYRFKGVVRCCRQAILPVLEQYYGRELYEYQKVALFLCYLDIEIGSSITIPAEYRIDPDLYYTTEGIVTEINHKNNVVHFDAPCTVGGTIHSGVYMRDLPFKIRLKVW